MSVRQKQIDAVVALPGGKRFERFVKVVADRQCAWGLYRDGWALAADDAGRKLFPLWPEREYAEICAKNEWANFEPRHIAIEDLLGALLPKLERDDVLPGVFFTPASTGVTPTVAELKKAIETELENY